MAEGSFATLIRNSKNFVPGMMKLATQAPRMLSVYRKIKERTILFGPDAVKMQSEHYETGYWKRHLCQRRNSWVDTGLSTEVSQKELAEYHTFRMDLWKVMHTAAWPLILGGWALPVYAYWLQNDTWVPSTFAQTAEEKKVWRHAQDLYRYKHIPSALCDGRWWTESHCLPQIPEREGIATAWDEIYEKNDVRKDPASARKVALFWDYFQPFFGVRRMQIRFIARAMGIPTFPTWAKINLQARVLQYWEVVFNEDYMVLADKNALNAMSDEELYDFAWRRFLAPYDKNVSREELLQRIGDYHQFLRGTEFLAKVTPNLFATNMYVMSYYNDPAFLDADISELEQNDYDHLASWGKDMFMQRLEFENGPLRDQVEAHSVKMLAERQKKLAAE